MASDPGNTLQGSTQLITTGGKNAGNAVAAPANIAPAATGHSVDPRDRSQAVSFRYYVEMQGVVVAGFTECSGLSLEREVVPYKEGGVNDFVHQLPGRVTQSKITLKRGITYSQDLWKWFAVGMYDGKVKRINLSIIIGNAEGKKVQHWDVISAWPVKYEGPQLKSDSNEAAIETIEIAHHGLRLSTETGSAMGLTR